MKSFTIKALAVVISFAAICVSGFSQTREVEHDFSEFDAISATNSFKVSIANSDTYKIKVTVDDALESYVQCYVKSKVLYITLDEKSIPKEVKKAYSGKNNSGPTLNAVVYMPVLNSISLSDDAVFTSTQTLKSNKFSLNLSGNSSISNLNVDATSANISVTKKAKLSAFHVSATDVSVVADNNATILMEFASTTLAINNSGSAQLTVNGEASKAVVTTSGSSSLNLSGKAPSLTLNSKGGSSKVDATSLTATDAVLAIAGTDAKINASKTLSLELGKGSTVFYAGDPQIKIVSIQNSSVVRK